MSNYPLNQQPYRERFLGSTNRTGESHVYGQSTRPNTMPHRNTNQSRYYNEDLVQMIAKIRSLEDDLLNERFKTESLTTQLTQAQKSIQNLQYEVTSLSYELDKYRHEIELSNQKNVEIMKYEQNLKIIGQEIQQLNEVLIKKNKEYELVLRENRHLKYECNKTHEENELLTINNNLCRNELKGLVSQIEPVVTHLLTSSAYESQLFRSNKALQDLNSFHSFNDEITLRFNQVREMVSLLEKQCKKRTSDFEVKKKQLIEDASKAKEDFLKLQYEHRLLEERTKDTNRQQDLMKACYNEKKVEEIIEEMLQKEDEYIARIQRLNDEVTDLKDEILELRNNQSFSEKVEKEEHSSIVQNLKKENHLLEKTIAELGQKIRTLESSYEEVMTITERSNSKELESELIMMRKLRAKEEENLEYKSRIQQMVAEIELLNKQMDILKGE